MTDFQKARRAKYTGSLPAKGTICSVQDCRSKYLQKMSVRLSYFRIPRPNETTQMHELWKARMGISRSVSWLRVCELHFSKNCFIRDLEAELTGRPVRKRIRDGSIPSLFLTKEANQIDDIVGESPQELEQSHTLVALANEVMQQRTFVRVQATSVQADTMMISNHPPLISNNGLRSLAPKTLTGGTCFCEDLNYQKSRPAMKSNALSLLFNNATEESSKNDPTKNPRPLSPDLDPELCSSDQIDHLKTMNVQLQKQVMNLKDDVSELTSKLVIQRKLTNSGVRKCSKRESVIKKLRCDLSSLRKERRKLRQREYMRKFKHSKVVARRKERRVWITEQIQAGKMDKNSLALVYSRKTLPYEQQQQQQKPATAQYDAKHATTNTTTTTTTTTTTELVVNIDTIVRAVDQMYANDNEAFNANY
jgi:hypothetical protein